MKGDLTEEVSKGGKTFTRKLNPDLDYTAPDGSTFEVACRSLMLVRNVGHLMTNPAILDRDGNEVPEGIMDAAVTALIALHDIGRNGRRKNSRAGSMYIVKPKMHGPEEVAFAVEIFCARREAARVGAEHAEDGHHGRGAPHHGEPQGVHPRGKRPGGVHQHRLPRPHRRRDPHLDGSRADDPQGRHAAGRLDFRLRGMERRHRARMRPVRPRPDRQGHVGDARSDGGDAGAEDRPSEGRREHRLGAVADRRDAACDALSQGRRACRAGEA